MADALEAPVAYLLARDDRLARMILAVHALPVRQQDRVLRELERASKP